MNNAVQAWSLRVQVDTDGLEQIQRMGQSCKNVSTNRGWVWIPLSGLATVEIQLRIKPFPHFYFAEVDLSMKAPVSTRVVYV